jgi:cytochrome c peroxidase
MQLKQARRTLQGRSPLISTRKLPELLPTSIGSSPETLREIDQTALDHQGQMRTLGKLLLFDKHLSVNQNEACSFCHTPETGFTGPIQSLNLSTVSYPGSVRTRFSNASHRATCMQRLRLCFTTMRCKATSSGESSGTCAPAGIACKIQALNKPRDRRLIVSKWACPTRPCLAYRLSKAPYRKLFETVWGTDSSFLRLPHFRHLPTC